MDRITYSSKDIMGFEQRYRAMFINSLGGFKSLSLVGTRNSAGQSNLAVFSSFFHIGANPPLFGIIIRPDSVERHTLNNILATRIFTVNHVREEFYKAAHQTSARYAQDESEFAATGLTEENIPGYYAPFVAESHVKIGASFRQKIDLAINGTIMILAEIKYVSIPSDTLMPDGYVDLEKAGTITCAGLDSYHRTERIGRLEYAKVGSQTEVSGNVKADSGIKA
jgi:flavin reductase (DIM6/NTAB) family NADH-FMN oxidoreductase RutF